MRSKNKRGKGTVGASMNVHSARDEVMGERAAGDLLDAIFLQQTDPDVKALAEAKRQRDEKEIGRLILVLKERYGAGKPLLRLFKAL